MRLCSDLCRDVGLEELAGELLLLSSERTSMGELIRSGLSSMEEEWRPVCFATKQHTFSEWEGGESSITLLRSVDEIKTISNDHSASGCGLLYKPLTCSPCPPRCARRERAQAFADKLELIDRTVAALSEVQKSWLYFMPVFASKLLRALPAGESFVQMDRKWREAISALDSHQDVLSAIEQPSLAADNLAQLEKELEQIQQGLDTLLETKRLQFPRRRIRWVCRRCAKLGGASALAGCPMARELAARWRASWLPDGARAGCLLSVNVPSRRIAELEFDDNLQIYAMKSSKKERVPFIEPIDPRSTGMQVEKWLPLVVHGMKATVTRQVEMCHAAFGSKPRIDWGFDWPGAISLLVSQIMWTANAEAALLCDDPNALRAYEQRCSAELDQCAIRALTQLSALQRMTLGAAIVLDLHSRDVLSVMVTSGVDSPSHFEWRAQLRYYLDTASATVEARMVTAGVTYGNEYLGNTPRLVVTALTDRCYRSLMLAVQLHQVGAPSGPAGTGKTETTKDLAKAVGMQCIVFNCSNQVDYIAMGKFFRGLASLGSWGCFDEFNRIDLEVLSVVAQQ
eukprot:4063390-Prymnesium_polylepis.3